MQTQRFNKNKQEIKQFQNNYKRIQRYIKQKQLMKIRPSLSRYDVDQGFQQHQTQSEPVFQIDKSSSPGFLFPISKNQSKSRSLSKKQQAKIRFISIQRQKSQSSHYEYLKKQHQKNIHKSLTLNKEEQSFFSTKKKNKISKPPNRLPPMQSFNNSVIKLKRSQIGENLEFIQFNANQIKTLKENIINNGASIIFQQKSETNSHGLFKKYLKVKGYNFLKSKYNSALLHKISTSYVNPKHQLTDKLSHFNSARKQLQFLSDFESSNLDFVTQINPFQYDLYIKADTNTMGHQNWFYFKLLNHTQEKKVIFLNVFNLKRAFKMIKKGQKIYYRFKKIVKSSLKTSIQTQDQQWTEWSKLEQQITVSPNFINSNNSKKRAYKLSFSSTLLPQTEYEFSLLPPFTYSSMLQKIQEMQKKSKNLTIQTLTYSHLGLCIPLLTFTNRDSINQNKKVILISGRIHPGQTCASFVIKGIVQKLGDDSQETNKILENYIIKIIPILNPDGVVLGNFRTNYLGSDLNRSFHEENQVTFPEVVALKHLGKRLKEQYKDKFLCFLDFHGHSSQKNIFTYGPNYDQRNKNYFNSRFLPKALSVITNQFDYDKCTFFLEECKSNTARGFFLRKLNVMAFTIQSSYALFDSNKQETLKNQDLDSERLFSFGHNVIKALGLWNNDGLNHQKIDHEQENSQQRQQVEKSMAEQSLIIKKIKKELIQQTKIKNRRRAKKRKASINDDESSQQDSDGQSESQDIPVKEKQKLYRRFIESNSSLFPRILRPAIIHPEVNPPAPLFSVSKINPSESVKGSNPSIRMKRNRYTNVKPINTNNAYTEYLLRQVKGLESLKPSVNLMKLSQKESSLIRTTNLEIK